MDVKATITGKDRKGILSSCEYGENVAQETYKNVLKEEMQHLGFKQQTMINAQLSLLKIDHDIIESMHDELMATS